MGSVPAGFRHSYARQRICRSDVSSVESCCADASVVGNRRVDQCVSWWIIAVGAAMPIAGIYAPILTLAAWVVYWTRVRG